MATVLVEARKSPEAGAFMNHCAAVCAQLGHRVIRWRGPRSGRVPHGRWLWPCDLAILFNGTHVRYAPVHRQLNLWNTPRIFVELGWHPQQGQFQVDPHGINAAASWSGDRLTSHCRTPLQLRSKGNLLVVLQDDEDTQIKHMSPWFGDMHSWVRHLAQHAQLPLRLRKHPRHVVDPRVETLASSHGICWDDSPSLTAALDACLAVACVNSSSGVEALSRKLPVLCFGKAIYRHPGAAFCLTDDGSQLRAVTRQLAEGRCELFAEPVEEVVRRVAAHQWTMEDVPVRLPAMMERLIAARAAAYPWWARIVPMLPVRRMAA